jgi:hypothetical protein
VELVVQEHLDKVLLEVQVLTLMAVVAEVLVKLAILTDKDMVEMV